MRDVISCVAILNISLSVAKCLSNVLLLIIFQEVVHCRISPSVEN